METKANYVIIGAFTFAVSIAAVMFGFFAARFATDSAWNDYRIVFNESVIGLSGGSPVLYNGVNVGRVTDLSLNPDDVREVIVTLEVQAQVPIHEDTVATIRLTGLTGTAAIQLSGGSPDSPLLSGRAEPPERIEAVSSPLHRLLESSEGIIVILNRALQQVDAVLSETNVERVDATLASLERFGHTLADPGSSLSRLLDNASEASNSLPEVADRLSTVLERLDNAVTDIDRGLIADLPDLKARLAGTLANLESVSGRLDAMVADTRDELGGLGLRQVPAGMEEIRRLVRDLSELVRRIERDPARFLRGGEKPEEYPSQ